MSESLFSIKEFDEEKLQDFVEKYDTIINSNLKNYSHMETTLSCLQKEHKDIYDNLINCINNVFIISEQNFERTVELDKTALSSTLSKFHSFLKTNKYEKNYEISLKIYQVLQNLNKEQNFIHSTWSYLHNLQIIKLKCKKINQDFQSKHRGKLLLECSGNLHEIMVLIKNDFAYLNTEFAKKTFPTGELPMEPQQFINKMMNDILIINKKNFDEACEKLYKDSNDSKSLHLLQESLQIFPLINQPQLGLTLYSKYICNIINDKSRDIMVLQKKKLTVPQCFLHLFKMCSMIINNHSKIIIHFYNKESMITIMENLLKEIDLQSSLLLDIFMDEFTQSKNGNTDQFINDFLIILGYWSMFEKFFAIKYKEFSVRDETATKTIIHVPKCINVIQFTHKLNTIINDLFKEKFQNQIQNNLGKVFDMENFPNINSYISSFNKPSFKDNDVAVPISSLTDDFSIILKKYLITIINTGDFVLVHDFMAVFLPNTIIKDGFIKQILHKLSDITIAPAYLCRYTDSLEKIDHQSSNGPVSTDYDSSAGEKMFKTAFSSIQQYATVLKNSSTSNLVKELFAGKQIVADEYTTVIDMQNFHMVLVYMNTIQDLKYVLEKLLLQELILDNNILSTNYIFDDDAKILESTITKSYNSSIEYCDLVLKSYTAKIFEIGLKHACHSLGKLLLNGKQQFISTGTDNVNVTQNSKDPYFCNASDFEDLGMLADFIRFWAFISQPYKNVCDPKIYSLVLLHVVEYFNSNVILPKFWKLQRVNELGALKLDKEMSLFISVICSSDNYYLREKFDKINQLVLVLGFENEDFTNNPETGLIELKADLKESIAWCITEQEIHNVRHMRV